MVERDPLTPEGVAEIVDGIEHAEVLEGAGNMLAVKITHENGKSRVLELTFEENGDIRGRGQEI